MTHHDHDRDLIMALAEGALDERTAEAARREIDGCAECIENLALQRAALAVFSAAPSVQLTELEAGRLKRDLDTALGHERTLIAPAPQRRKSFNWVPVFSVAAVLIALVLVAPTLDLLGGGADDSAGDAVALDAVTESADNGADDRASLQSTAQSPSVQSLVEDTEPIESAEDGATPASTTTVVAASEGDDDYSDETASTVEELLVTLDEVLDPADTIEESRMKAVLFGLMPPEEDDDERCLVEAAIENDFQSDRSYVLGDIDTADGPVRITAHPLRNEIGLIAHEGDSCEVLAVSSS